MKNTKAIALCGMISALAVVIMLLGGALGVGTYASPMIASLLLMAVGKKYEQKYHLAAYAAVSVLSFTLVTDIEQVLVFVFLFGLYPIIRPYFHKLTKILRIISKLLFFNAVVTALEALVMLFLAPEVMSAGLIVSLLLFGNIMFICIDFIIGRYDVLYRKYLAKILDRF